VSQLIENQILSINYCSCLIDVQTKSVYYCTRRDASWEGNDIWTMEMLCSEE